MQNSSSKELDFKHEEIRKFMGFFKEVSGQLFETFSDSQLAVVQVFLHSILQTHYKSMRANSSLDRMLQEMPEETRKLAVLFHTYGIRHKNMHLSTMHYTYKSNDGENTDYVVYTLVPAIPGKNPPP